MTTSKVVLIVLVMALIFFLLFWAFAVIGSRHGELPVISNTISN